MEKKAQKKAPAKRKSPLQTEEKTGESPQAKLEQVVFGGLRDSGADKPAWKDVSRELKEHALLHPLSAPHSLPGEQRMIQTLHGSLSDQVEEMRIRFLYLTESVSAEKYRYEWLELHTGVSSARWQNVLLEKQLPTVEMLMAICNLCNGYAHWLMHGSIPGRDDPLYHLNLRAPSEEAFNFFKDRREWINQMKKEKGKQRASAKKSTG